MATWDRNTPWRQGHTLTTETALTLGLVGEADTANSVVVVISHDCDLVQNAEIEPCAEAIIGLRINAPDGNFTYAKNSRRLHLPFTEESSTVYLDLRATDKQLVPKDTIAGHLPNHKMSLSRSDRSVLQRWLAARYRRSAFPDEFERRLQASGLDKRIAKIIEPLGPYIIAVFFDVDDGEEIQREASDDPYTLRIHLLYSTENEPEAAMDAAAQAAHKISDAFRTRGSGSENNRSGIALLECEAISDFAMTFAMSVQVKKWNADYLTFRAGGDSDPTLPD
jgi:hypothetical protein